MKRLVRLPRVDCATQHAPLKNDRFSLAHPGTYVAWKEPISGICWSLFSTEYLNDNGFYRYVWHTVSALQDSRLVELTLKVRYIGQGALLRGRGENFVEALIDALGLRFEVKFLEQHFAEFATVVQNVAFVEILTSTRAASFGIGVHSDSTTAACLGVLIAVNRAIKLGVIDDSMNVAAD